MSAIDITTGNVLIDEGISNITDTEIAFDNTLRFLSITQPKEIFVTLNGKGKYDINMLINMLQIDTRIVSVKKFDEKYTKIKFQTEFLGQIYKNSLKMNMNIIEILNLEKVNYARISLVMLIDNVRNYSENLIKDISEPEINIDTNHMILGNNAIFQLSILENDIFNYLNGTKFKCLYDVVNNAKTAMGKRFIKHILCNPLISDKKIKEYYDLTEFIIKNSLYDKYSEKLKQIIDIEKYSRKMNLTMLNPYELLDFIDSIDFCKDIINNIKIDKISIEFKKDKFIKIEEFIKDMNITFNKNELQCNILNDIKTNLFKPNISKDIDLLCEDYNAEHKLLNNLQDVFNKVLLDYQKGKSDKKSDKKSKKVVKVDDTNYLKISSTPSEGYFIMTSKQRFDIIKKHYEKTKEIILLPNKMEINFENLEIKDLKNSIKIFFKNTKSKDRDIAEIENKLLKLVYDTYIIKLKEFYEKYNDIFVYICNYITKLDYVVSNAITAKLYNYVKPNLLSNISNYIKCKQIRQLFHLKNSKTIKDKMLLTILISTSFLVARDTLLTLRMIKIPHPHSRLLIIQIRQIIIWLIFKILKYQNIS
jgi:DNA mismatch repair ATPase MutS